MSNNNKPNFLNSPIGRIGTIGAIVGLLLAAIPIVQAMLGSREQGNVDATSIAIQAAQLEVMIEQATLEALQSIGIDNATTATSVAERLTSLEGTATSLEIRELEGTIEALEEQQIPLEPSATSQPASTPSLAVPSPTTSGPTSSQTAPTASVTSPAESTIVTEFSVEAQVEINLTGIIVGQGDVVTIQFAEGQWRAGPLPTWPFYGPSGDPQVPSKETFPVKDKPIMALVGGIGQHPAFWVGPHLEFVSTLDGELWLGANDDEYSDNSGSLEVIISITAPN